MMKKKVCAVCGVIITKEPSVILYMPPNVFIRMCDLHIAMRIQEGNKIGIESWVKREKARFIKV